MATVPRTWTSVRRKGKQVRWGEATWRRRRGRRGCGAPPSSRCRGRHRRWRTPTSGSWRYNRSTSARVHHHQNDSRTEKKKSHRRHSHRAIESAINWINSTLLSDLVRSLRKTAFLSAEASVDAMVPTHTRTSPIELRPLRTGIFFPCSIDGWANRSARERGRGVARWEEMEGKGWRRGGRGKNGGGGQVDGTVLPLPSASRPPGLRARVSSFCREGKGCFACELLRF